MSLIWNARTYYLSQLLTLSYISHKYQNNLESHSNPNWIGVHHYYLYHCNTDPSRCFKSIMKFTVFKIMLVLPRMGKWSISKVFSVLHLNLTCGKLFLLVQLATILRIFSYCIHRATVRAQPKQEQKQSKLKQAHLCLVLFIFCKQKDHIWWTANSLLKSNQFLSKNICIL